MLISLFLFRFAFFTVLLYLLSVLCSIFANAEIHLADELRNCAFISVRKALFLYEPLLQGFLSPS